MTATLPPPPALLDPAPTAASTHGDSDGLTIHVGDLRGTLLRSGWLLAETVLIPTSILLLCLHTLGKTWGLAAVLGWCALAVANRVLRRGGRVPATMLIVVGELAARTALSLACSSVWLYVLQPVVGSLVMSALFLGSAAIGRPITARLAQDFVHLPTHLFADRRMRRIFIEVAVIFGTGRLADVGLSLGTLHLGITAAVAFRGFASTVLTLATIAACILWGMRRLRAIPGIRVRLGNPV